MERHKQDRQGRTRLSAIVPAGLGCDGLRWAAMDWLCWLAGVQIFAVAGGRSRVPSSFSCVRASRQPVTARLSNTGPRQVKTGLREETPHSGRNSVRPR